MIRNYRDLTVWQKAYRLALGVYKTTLSFPKHELYGLVSQLRRCSISIVSNIAEGHHRNSTKQYLYFIGIARGSTAELDTQLRISKDLNYLTVDKYTELSGLIVEISKMLFAIQKKLK